MADVFPDFDVIYTGSSNLVTMMSRMSIGSSETVTSSNAVSTTPRARFLPELWAMTINNMRDRKSQTELAYLWTTVRRVSKDFEREIEKLFQEEHIGKTWIHADCGYRCDECRTFRRTGTSCEKTVEDFGPSHGYSIYANSSFSFINLDIDDEKIAVFKYRREGKPDDEDPDHSVIHGLLLRLSNKERENLPLMEKAEATTRLRDRYRYRSSTFHYKNVPTFVVQVRGGLIDLEVSISRLDVENEGVSVNWKMFFTSYFEHFLRGAKQEEMVSPS